MKNKKYAFIIGGLFFKPIKYFQPHEIKNEFVEKDKKIIGGEDQYRKLMILFANVIQSIGEQLKLRQQVIATATGKPIKNSKFFINCNFYLVLI